jgi:hypothetical protein
MRAEPSGGRAAYNERGKRGPTMGRIGSIHEYDLKPGISGEENHPDAISFTAYEEVPRPAEQAPRVKSVPFHG